MTQKNSKLKGILYMILNSFSLSLIYILMKKLTITMDSSQVVFFYKFFCLIIILPWVLSSGFLVLKTTQLKLHILRGFFSASGSLLFMHSLKYVEVVNAIALAYLEQMLWTVIAIIFFNEKFSIGKLLAIFTSFFGALAVIYPGLIDIHLPFINFSKINLSHNNKYYFFTLLAVLSWTANSISVKILGRTAKNKAQVFYALLFSSLFSFPIAFISWKYVNFGLVLPFPEGLIPVNSIDYQPTYFLCFFIIIICYIIHSVAFFKAMKKANMSDLAPYHYLKIIFVGVLEYLFFNQKPDQCAFFGYLLIVGSGVFLIKREHKVKKVRRQK